MSTRIEKRSEWVGYLRVSTPEQAERDLSLPAQRRAVEEYAARNGRTLARVYVEEGCSRTHMNRRAFREYGAKSVATALNERGLHYRRESPWSKDLVLHILEEPAAASTYLWGRWSAKRKNRRDERDWLQLKVEPIVDPALHELAIALRKQREPKRNPGTPLAPANLLGKLLRCGRCGASFQLETSGKRAKTALYQYRYYNCRTFLRVGSTKCPGERIPTAELDSAVLAYIAGVICAPERCASLGRMLDRSGPVDGMEHTWSTLVRAGGTVSRNYLLHLIERIEVRRT